jgi:hypothetical protein
MRSRMRGNVRLSYRATGFQWLRVAGLRSQGATAKVPQARAAATVRGEKPRSVRSRVIRQPEMRRTLLAVGIAVVASMLLAPHRDRWEWLCRSFYAQPVMAQYISTDPNAGLVPGSSGYNPNLPPHSYYENRDAEHPQYYQQHVGYIPDYCNRDC